MLNAQSNAITSHVICKQPGRYIGWPTIAKAPGGELFVVFSGDREAHVCPYGKTFIIRSSDNGETWSEPHLLNNTPLDDRDAGICACSDGTLVVSWFTALSGLSYLGPHEPQGRRDRWTAHLATISDEDVQRWTHVDFGIPRGHWFRRSPDLGQTWEEPIRAPGTAPHGPIELSDGRLFFVGNNGHDRKGKTTSIVAAESLDKGRTWRTLAHIPMFPAYHGDAPDGIAFLAEPHVVEVSPGRLLAMARYEESPYREGRTNCVLWQFSSEDGGHTWTEPRPTEILGKPPHLLKLRDGRVLVTYGYRHAPYGQRACFSHDGGATWDYANEVVLRDDAPNGDLGYPATAECDDGTLLTVYYQIDKPGEKTSLMMTQWKA